MKISQKLLILSLLSTMTFFVVGCNNTELKNKIEIIEKLENERIRQKMVSEELNEKIKVLEEKLAQSELRNKYLNEQNEILKKGNSEEENK